MDQRSEQSSANSQELEAQDRTAIGLLQPQRPHFHGQRERVESQLPQLELAPQIALHVLPQIGACIVRHKHEAGQRIEAEKHCDDGEHQPVPSQSSH